MYPFVKCRYCSFPQADIIYAFKWKKDKKSIEIKRKKTEKHTQNGCCHAKKDGFPLKLLSLHASLFGSIYYVVVLFPHLLQYILMNEPSHCKNLFFLKNII